VLVLVVGVRGREVERGEGRGVRGFADRCCCWSFAIACACSGRVWRTDVAAIVGMTSQRSDYGQAVAGSLCLRHCVVAGEDAAGARRDGPGTAGLERLRAQLFCGGHESIDGQREEVQASAVRVD
jgi:hypothetical protein